MRAAADATRDMLNVVFQCCLVIPCVCDDSISPTINTTIITIVPDVSAAPDKAVEMSRAQDYGIAVAPDK
jgi:hypothetical protein